MRKFKIAPFVQCICSIFLPWLLPRFGALSFPFKTGDQSTIEPVLGKECGHVCHYEYWFHRAHCDERELLHVPTSSGCEGVTLLELQGNKITTVSEEQLSGYKRVITIDLSRNEISNLDPGTFLNSDRLKNIILSHNTLWILHDGTFKGTEPNLSRMYLDHNELHLIEEEALRGLRHVTSLYLNNNKLQLLYVNVFSDMTELSHLSLAHNELITLDKRLLKNLTNLLTLNLEGNNLMRVPKEFFINLHSLQEVNLSHNQLTTILPPQDIGFNYLKMVNLQDNNINRSADIIPFLYNVTDVLCFAGNPLYCDCDFKIIQEWLKITNDDHSCSERVVTCKFIDESFADVTDEMKLNCARSDHSNSTVQITDIPTPDESNSPSPLHTITPKAMHPVDYPGNSSHSKPVTIKSEYRVHWISLYNAIIFTCYILFRAVKSCQRPKRCSKG